MRDDMPSLIIDASYIGYQARYTMGDLSHDDLPTGVLFGFLSRILSLGLQFGTNDISFCWDSKHSLRKDIFSGYKKKERTDEEWEEIGLMKDQFKILRQKVLPKLGFKNHFIQSGYECDDIMASIVFQKLGEWILVTGDEDLFQCLRPNCKVYSPSKKIMMTQRRFMEEKGITPRAWVKVKQIAGCKSDAVLGIVGVGEKKAIQYLTRSMKPGKILDKINDGKKLIKRNQKLVELPFPGTEEVTFQPNIFSMKGLKKVCKHFGFDSFLQDTKLEEWNDLFTIHMREPVQSRYNKKRRVR